MHLVSGKLFRHPLGLPVAGVAHSQTLKEPTLLHSSRMSSRMSAYSSSLASSSSVTASFRVIMLVAAAASAEMNAALDCAAVAPPWFCCVPGMTSRGRNLLSLVTLKP